MSEFFLLHEKVLLSSEKNETFQEAFRYFFVLTEKKTFLWDL